MRKYETVFISDSDMSDQAREELLERVRSIIERENGILLNVDEWGLKKLSYEIKKKLRGYYVCLTYGGTGALVTELERNFRLSDFIMKFMTILITEHVTEESLRQEAEEAKAAAQQAEESATKAEAVPQEAEVKKDQGDAEETSDKAEENADDQDDAQETESKKTSEPAEESKE
ncbi:30S ribosomal protein S6 [Desulfobacter hydrogenophilus]|uniref:Small ribosomal subunit protein bS6 n=1 Tax=Desulfobacter hydrogenophilus TaxID=2291 RepID=A0A328F9Z2_9BACT|nr:30S ribosomal protein S6 [Desulfobacter hydrogenophilus]NDY72126.1 30S ribosomal protein S6 [Desulfobacter hydrogenophilus]QBH14851.1 30S ribosomal protein S6 [Desulfobacter hydrogenophilus]RAM01358.1 30S ribosomal protein S6 [Desulfobacter hydrogenophilus]